MSYLRMTQMKSDLDLTGKLLLAMPNMTDPRFHRAVIFMCTHDDNGAMGLVVNKKLAGIQFGHLLEQLKIISDITIDRSKSSIPVMAGGPVEESRGFILHSMDFKQPDTVIIDETYGVTGTIEALRTIAVGQGPGKMMFLLGYAGWGSGQLEQEIQDNAWLVVEPDQEIIFDLAHDEKWTRSVQKLGFDPAMLSSEVGRA